jgi:DUF1009 family protein
MRKIGIIAGEGQLPKSVISHCIQHNIAPFIIKISSQSDAEYQIYDDVCFVKLGMVSKALAYFKKHGVRELVLAGRISRPKSLFSVSVDIKGAALLGKLALNHIFGDDHLLVSVKDFLNEEGFDILSLNNFMSEELFCTAGVLSILNPNEEDLINLALGKDCLQAIAKFDVGQALLVAGKRIIAIEAAEGTDNMLARSRHLITGRCCMIKAAKANQITEIDLPAIGVETIKLACAAGVTLIAIEASKTIVIDKVAVLDMINSNKMILMAF